MAPIQGSPIDSFLRYNDQDGNRLVSLNKDGSVSTTGVGFSDGTVQSSAFTGTTPSISVVRTYNVSPDVGFPILQGSVVGIFQNNDVFSQGNPESFPLGVALNAADVNTPIQVCIFGECLALLGEGITGGNLTMTGALGNDAPIFNFSSGSNPRYVVGQALETGTTGLVKIFFNPFQHA